jgi:hypothetical protein
MFNIKMLRSHEQTSAMLRGNCQDRGAYASAREDTVEEF